MKKRTLIWAVLIAVSIFSLACGKSRPAPTLEKRDAPAEEKTTPKEEATPAPEEAASATSTESNAVDPDAASAATTPGAAAGAVTVTRITKEDDGLVITLNDAIVIRGVSVKSGQFGKFLGFPERRAQDGEFWPYIRVSRDAGDRLAGLVDSNKTEDAPKGFEITSVTVKMLNKPEGKKKAFVEFELSGGAVKLLSWGIVEGTKGAFLVPPSEKVGSDYKDLVHAANKEFFEKLKTAALAEYKNQGGVVTP